MEYEISDGIIESAQKVVIYGPEGIGKSSLAAQFPKPLFIDTEGSTKKLNVARFNKGIAPSSWTILLDQVEYIKRKPQLCETLIIDTADWAERLTIDFVLTKYKKDGIEGFGYSKGYTYLAEEFGKLLNALTDLINLEINVVIIAHASPRKFELPDEAGAFDRWEMKLTKKVAPLVKEWADIVLFCNYITHVIKSENKMEKAKAQGGGKRVIYTTHHACWDAKNRHDLPVELSFNSPQEGFAQIAHCIPSRGQQSKPAAPKEPELAQELDEFEAPTEPKQQLTGVPKALADLMTANNVTVEEIQQVVSERGYYPENTPISNYAPDFIDGVLVGAWAQVHEMIIKNRK